MENQKNLVVTHVAAESLRTSAKWSMFMSIVGFIFVALMLIFGAFATLTFSAMPDNPAFGSANPFNAVKNYIGIIYLVMAAVYFFPILYLYKYSKGIKEALAHHNSETLAHALENLKSHHKFLGILTIVVLCLYALAFLSVIVFAASMASGM